MAATAVDFTTTTGLAIIERAYRILGKLAAGESLTSDEQADGLEGLNALLESLSIDRGLAYRVAEITHTLTATDASYTIGTDGTPDIDTERPVAIESGFIRWEDADTPLEVVNGMRFDAQLDKTLTGIPIKVFYDGASPNGTLTFYYVPDAAYVAHLRVLAPFVQFSAVADSVKLPPGMKRLLDYNLAVDLAPELRAPLRPDVQRIADLSKAAFRKSVGGTKDQPALSEAYLLSGSRLRGSSILTG